MPPLDADALARGDILPEEDTLTDEGSAAADPAPEEGTPSPETPPEPGGEASDGGDETVAGAEEGDSDSDKDHRIPKERFDQAVRRERERAEAAQRELQKYRERDKQLAEAEDTEAAQAKIKELLKQHSSLLADGELDKASEVMEEVLQRRDDLQTARMQRQADNARNSAKIEVQYDQTVQALEAEYPEINPDADEFDETVVRRVQMMVTGIMQNEGKNPADALREATEILLKPAKEARALRAAPSQDTVETGLRRTQAAIDKNVKTAAAQPPSTRDVGQDHDSVGGGLDAASVAKLSWEDFIKLPDEELAKLRGDHVE
jgi:molybdopterin converting factor small subunit